MTSVVSIESAAQVAPASHPPAHPVWSRVRDALVALSLANVCLIGAWYPILNDTDFGYFDKAPVARCVVWAMEVNFLWCALAAWLVIRALRRWRNRWFQLGCHCLLLALFLLPLNFARVAIFSFASSQVLVLLKQPPVAFGIAVVIVVVVWQHRRAAITAAVLLGILSPLALFTLARLTLLNLGVIHLAQPAPDPRPPALGPLRENQPRVVWLIFDETDQRVVFEKRPVGLQLTEFDRLRSQSLYATNAFPPGNFTEVSMPALISGQPICFVSPTNGSDLAVTLSDSNQVTVWSALPSVFESARRLDCNTALVGWYHPYSRILGQSLNFCQWFPAFMPSRATTFSAAFTSQLSSLTRMVTIRGLFADACRDSIDLSLSLVTNRIYGLTLLHLPPPHAPGIYNPALEQYSTAPVPTVTGYFNNLKLADRALGQFRRALESSGQATNTWLILSADHSWRKSRDYDGGRDLRVPFLVKAPGESTPLTYATEIKTIITHDLILAILRGQIAGQQSLVPWLDARAKVK